MRIGIAARLLPLFLLSCDGELGFEQGDLDSATAALHPLVRVGSLPGELTVGDDGSASYSVPLWVPPGRAGMQPELAITYNSRGGPGPMGIGWSINDTSKIARCTRSTTGVLQPIHLTNQSQGTFGDLTKDALCLDGARLIEVGHASLFDCTGPQYRTIPDNFANIIACGATATTEATHWRVVDKGGLFHAYGNSSDSRVRGTNPYGVTATLAWHVKSTADQSGNAMLHVYEPNAVGRLGIRTKQIRYTYGNKLEDGPSRSVDFVYDDTFTTPERAVGGLWVNSNGRISRIRMKADSRTVREYRLTYEARLAGIDTRSLRLISMTACDGDTSAAACVPSTSFEYAGPEEDATWAASEQGAIGDGFDYRIQGSLQFADVNGDALDDMLYWPPALGNWRVRLSTGTGFAAPLELPHYASDELSAPILLHDHDLNGTVNITTHGCSCGQFDARGNCTGVISTTCKVRSYEYSSDQFFVVGPNLPDKWYGPTTFAPLFERVQPQYLDFTDNTFTERHRFRYPLAPGGPNVPGLAIGVDEHTRQLLAQVTNDDDATFSDLDNDGIAEMLLRRSQTGDYFAANFKRAGSGQPLDARAHLINLRGRGRCSVWGDFNGDAMLDVVNLCDKNGDGFLDGNDVGESPEDKTLNRVVYDGRAFVAETPYFPAFTTILPGCHHDDGDTPARDVGQAGYHLVDYNGDGLLDILVLGKTSSDPTERARVFITRHDIPSIAGRTDSPARPQDSVLRGLEEERSHHVHGRCRWQRPVRCPSARWAEHLLSPTPKLKSSASPHLGPEWRRADFGRELLAAHRGRRHLHAMLRLLPRADARGQQGIRRLRHLGACSAAHRASLQQRACRQAHG